MTDLELQVIELERLAQQIKDDVPSNPCSPSGMGDKVSGIQVIGPDGTIKQEWHDE